MVREQGPFRTDSPWPRIGWQIIAAFVVGSFLLAFFVGGAQPGARSGHIWQLICSCLGITTDSAAANALQPRLRTPTRVAWTPQTLSLIGHGEADHGAFIALNCTACHGARGISTSALYPTLAGMERATIFKQLDDFRSGKRASGAMQAIAGVLSARDSADVAAYFAAQTGGLRPMHGEALEAGHSLRDRDTAKRLVFAGDPARSIPPCSACHGPGDMKLGAPPLSGQQRGYIEGELGAFAQGIRRNDINEQMRTIASQLNASEMHEVAQLYGEAGALVAAGPALARR